MPDSVIRSSKTMQEVRIDYLLEEELSCDRRFAEKFLEQCRPSFSLRSVLTVAHSVSDRFGEADLIAIINVVNEGNIILNLALLIEDKITTSFQPLQGERYRQRGIAGIEDGLWDDYVTILVAPLQYLKRPHSYQTAIALEDVISWLNEDNLTRLTFKRQVIEQAIAKKAFSGVQVVDPAMTAFRKAHYGCLAVFNDNHGTDFIIREPHDTYWGDNWFEMTSAKLPSGCQVRHLAPSGKVQIRFKNVALEHAEPILRQFIEEPMAIVAGGKRKQHVDIELITNPINDFNDFEAQKAYVEKALLSAARMWRLVLSNPEHASAITQQESVMIAGRPSYP